MKHFIVLCFFIVAASADWCDPDLCPAPGLMHIACNNDGSYSDKCPPGASIIELSQKQIDAFLDEHNKKRSQQAQGKTPGFAPAKRMATITWDDTLANFCQLNTIQCEMNHDQCHSTPEFKYSGQNLAGNYETDDEQVVRAATDLWFNEYSNADMNAIRKHTSLKGANGKWTGHFTQVVKDNAIKMGCAVTRFTDKAANMPYNQICCNYAVANVQGQPIYIDGKTASGCKTGTNSKYPGLCSEKEDYSDGILL